MIEMLDEVLMVDFPKLMQQFPLDVRAKPSEAELNPFASGKLYHIWLFLNAVVDEDPNFWQQYEAINYNLYGQNFASLQPADGKVSGGALKPVFMESGLAVDILSKIWKLADIDKGMQLWINSHHYPFLTILI